MSTEPKRGTCDNSQIPHFKNACHCSMCCANWREVESAPAQPWQKSCFCRGKCTHSTEAVPPAQPGAGYRISDEYGCNCGVGNCDPVAHAADCPLKTRPPSVNPYRSVPPAAETAQPQHCDADNRQEYCPLAISDEAGTAMTAEQFASTELFRIEKDNLFCWKVYLCDSLICAEHTELRARNRVQRLSHLIDKKLAAHVREAAHGPEGIWAQQLETAEKRTQLLLANQKRVSALITEAGVIPVNKEGKIVFTNVRAEAAERKLAEVEKALRTDLRRCAKQLRIYGEHLPTCPHFKGNARMLKETDCHCGLYEEQARYPSDPGLGKARV